jgi:hypothetical protein
MDIADGIGWDGDPDQLVNALVQSGWLDECSCHRLRVHDWPEHADGPVRRTKDVSEAGFLECYETLKTSLNGGLENQNRHSEDGKTPLLPDTDTGYGSGNGNGSRKRNDVSEAGDDHREFLGEPSWARLGKALKPLIEAHTWDVVRPVWRAALKRAAESDKPGVFTPEMFARTFTAELNRARDPAGQENETTRHNRQMLNGGG